MLGLSVCSATWEDEAGGSLELRDFETGLGNPINK
jgi:hypothetical protein